VATFRIGFPERHAVGKETQLPLLGVIAIVIGSVVLALLLGLGLTLAVLGRRFSARLQAHPGFTERSNGESMEPLFSYADRSEPRLIAFRRAFDLASIAGNGSELARWQRLMAWVHGLTTHAPNPKRPEQMDGLYLTRAALERGQRFNCWMYATVLNDALLSLGYTSRLAHIYPIQEKPNESHLVVAAYSSDFGKWVQLDPDMCAIVFDDQGVPLHPGEIRKRLVRRAPLVVSDSVHMAYTRWLGRRVLKRLYVGYLAKNLFRMECPIVSTPGYETPSSGRTYIQLIPDGYHDEWLPSPTHTPGGNTIRYMRDESGFWQAPRRPDDASTDRP